MRLAWHIVRKDLFRLRWILLLWAVVLAGGLVLATIQSGLSAETYYPFWIVTNIVVVGFQPLFAFGLVMGLLHDDPVAEIDAFWITRPISGGELLLAKALALFLCALVPVLVMFPFWLAHDCGIAQLGAVVNETLLGHFLVAAAALPFALVSANGSKFVMNVLFGAGGLLLLGLALQLGGSRVPAGAPDLVPEKAWLIACLWLAVAALMVWNQFLRRRLRWSLAALAVGMVAGLLVAARWTRPLAFLAQPPAAYSPSLLKGAPTLTIGVDGEKRPTSLIGQVPLRAGASASRRGVTLKIQSVFVDFTGELQVEFSEAASLPARGLAHRLPGAAPRPPEPARYLLINPADKVILPVKTEPAANALEVAAMRFKHVLIRLRPAGSWQGTPPPDFKAWLQGAWLVKVLAPEPAKEARVSPL
ncbi:MAG TPA: hypothetical protein VG734_26545 [Lacunisphaera sp.]|nr:hypothetical protein [Lacunisphaera sp.]